VSFIRVKKKSKKSPKNRKTFRGSLKDDDSGAGILIKKADRVD
jgi:hypothetical protein